MTSKDEPKAGSVIGGVSPPFADFRHAVFRAVRLPARNPSPSRAVLPARRFCRHAGFLMASIIFMNVPCFCTLRIVIIPWAR